MVEAVALGERAREAVLGQAPCSSSTPLRRAYRCCAPPRARPRPACARRGRCRRSRRSGSDRTRARRLGGVTPLHSSCSGCRASAPSTTGSLSPARRRAAIAIGLGGGRARTGRRVARKRGRGRGRRHIRGASIGRCARRSLDRRTATACSVRRGSLVRSAARSRGDGSDSRGRRSGSARARRSA